MLLLIAILLSVLVVMCESVEAIRAAHPKLLVGYSDLTALFSAVVQRTGQLCLHGPVVAELGQPEAYHAPSLRRLLAGQSTTLRVRKRQVLAGGVARGRLMEETYRIDRALTHLKMAGAFRNLAAVLLGDFAVPASRRSFPPDRSLREVLAESFVPLGVPVIGDIKAGHVRGKWTLPLGGTARVDTAAGEVRLSP